jgi:hypothetical protein
LRKALADKDPEMVRQARECITAIERMCGPPVSSAAVHLLRERRPAGATPVLLAYVPAAPDVLIQEEVLDALLALGVAGGKVDPALVAALTDAAPDRRAAAALVVGQSGTPEQRAAVHRLLRDGEPRVRLRAAQGLCAARERTAVPVLVALVSEAPPDVADTAEELLARLAGERIPAGTPGGDVPARRKRREDWEAWWKSNESKLDLAHTDLGKMGTAQGARETVRRVLDALVDGDLTCFQRLTAVPFLFGSEEVRTRQGLDGIFQELTKEIKDGRHTFAVKDAVGVDRYAAAMRLNERDPVLKLRRPGVSVFLVQTLKQGKPFEGLAIFVRTRGGPPRVIGIGEAPSAAR